MASKSIAHVTTEGKVVTAARAGNLMKKSQEKQFLEIAKDKKWQGKLFLIRWEHESLSREEKGGSYARITDIKK